MFQDVAKEGKRFEISVDEIVHVSNRHKHTWPAMFC